MRTAVIIASAGRPQILAEAIRNIDELEGEFDRVVSVPDERSLPEGGVPAHWIALTGTRGSAAQRNAALDRLQGHDVLIFFDDDAVVRADYVVQAVKFFESHPHVVGITGEVLLDGAVIRVGEVSIDVARARIAESSTLPTSGLWRSSKVLYGCNFAVRFSAAPSTRFDARLPLYSWLEDDDFAVQFSRSGALAHVDDCVIVHRGAASGGREAHERFGYSQVCNPVYLWRKGSYSFTRAAEHALRSSGSNLLRSIRGPQWRRRRLHGNLLAAGDLLRGRVTPERILDL